MEEDEDTCFANLVLQRCLTCPFAAHRSEDLIEHARLAHNVDIVGPDFAHHYYSVSGTVGLLLCFR